MTFEDETKWFGCHGALLFEDFLDFKPPGGGNTPMKKQVVMVKELFYYSISRGKQRIYISKNDARLAWKTRDF